MDKKNNVFSIIGKIFVAIVVLVIALPFVLPNIIHAKFDPPDGNIYVVSDDSEFGYTQKLALVFDDNILHMYTYTVSVFGDISGLRLDYAYDGDSYYHLIGPIYLNPEPSILFWNNYSIFDRYTLDKAYVSFKLVGLRSLNASDITNVDSDLIQSTEVSIRTKSIMFDGQVFTLITEYDSTDYEIMKFDEESKEEKI